jgi:hypothetical protein
MIPWQLPDIAITDITFSERPQINKTITINVRVANLGNTIETFNLGVNITRISDPSIGTQSVTLAPRESKVLNFTWRPKALGIYKITAYTNVIQNDINPSNNIKIVFTRILKIKGPYYFWGVTEYWIVTYGKRPVRLIFNYY